MKKFTARYTLVLTLLVITISGCAPILLAGGAIFGAKGYVDDKVQEEQLGNNLKKIDSNLLKSKENKNNIDTLHQKIKMLESTVISLQKELLEKSQPAQAKGDENVIQ
jgi:hypothetical protein